MISPFQVSYIKQGLDLLTINKRMVNRMTNVGYAEVGRNRNKKIKMYEDRASLIDQCPFRGPFTRGEVTLG